MTEAQKIVQVSEAFDADRMRELADAEFPGLTAVDTVVREAQALVQRYRLMRRLDDGGRIRRDLRGDCPEPALVAEMVRQLVPGVDAPLTAAGIDWPIPAGVRLETLYASPWLEDVALPSGVYTLPQNATDFAGGFMAKTGILPGSEAMRRNYRITPIELGHIAEEVRGSAEKPSLAYLLLCSRHFEEAAHEAPVLSMRRKGIAFRRPLIDGFRLLAELEREALIIEDLGRINLLSVTDIRRWLGNGNVMPLARALRQFPQLKRLFDYQMIGTDAIGSFDNADAGDRTNPDPSGYVPIHPDLRFVAAARGTVDVDVTTALTQGGKRARLMLLAAFPKRDPGTRSSALDSEHPATFYGLNRTLTGAMQADLGHCFQHGDERNIRSDDIERQALLADTIVAHADPVRHKRNVRKNKSLAGKVPSGTNRQRDSTAHGQIMLPSNTRQEHEAEDDAGSSGLEPAPELPRLAVFGSAPRADPARWSDRWADAPLWEALLNRGLGNLPLGLHAYERMTIKAAFARLEALFERTFAAGCAADDVTGRRDAIHAASDLASGVSAISTNRHVGPAIRAWIKVFAVRPARLMDIKHHGTRWLPGLEHVSRVKKHVGAPPTGKKKNGTPRNERAATEMRNALRSSMRR